MHSIAGKRPTKTPCSCVQLTARFQKPNPQQLEFIRAAVARMPADSEIVSAMDADAEGGKFAEVVRRAVELSGRHDLRFTVMEPLGAKDFNDQLRARPHPLLPYRPEVPSVA